MRVTFLFLIAFIIGSVRVSMFLPITIFVEQYPLTHAPLAKKIRASCANSRSKLICSHISSRHVILFYQWFIHLLISIYYGLSVQLISTPHLIIGRIQLCLEVFLVLAIFNNTLYSSYIRLWWKQTKYPHTDLWLLCARHYSFLADEHVKATG